MNKRNTILLIGVCIIIFLGFSNFKHVYDINPETNDIVRKHDVEDWELSDVQPNASDSFKIPEKILVAGVNYNESSTIQLCIEELKNHLEYSLGKEITIDKDIVDNEGTIILLNSHYLDITDYFTDEEFEEFNKIDVQGYLIIPRNPNIIIASKSDIGILYGSYTFLEELGFSWISPDYTTIPKIDDNRAYDWTKIVDEPKFKYRGFWNYKEPSMEFVKWAVRNKYNLIGEVDPVVAEKYGINIWTGGHDLLYEFLNDEKLFSSNPKLYGMKNGKRVFVGDNPDAYMNPCFANRDLATLFSDFLINKFNLEGYTGKLFINIWPTDSSSNAYFCQSDESKEIGNPTDNLLLFYQNLVEELDKNNKSGFDIVINGITYYSTWNIPLNSYKINNENFRQIMYLNQRSFSNTINSDTFNSKVESWDKYSEKNGIRLGIVEYYNYSIYGGTLSDYNSVVYDDIRYYAGKNIDLFAYMHPLEGSSGTFDLLNYSLSKLLWNPNVTKEYIEAKYFKSLYQGKELEVKEIYKKVNYALSNRKEMLGQNSLRFCLFQETFWADPPYSSQEIKGFINRYLEGGKQQLPAKFQSTLDYMPANFVGLKGSIELLEESINELKLLKTDNLATVTIEKINNDLEWIETSLSVYKLLYNLSILRLDEFNDDNIDFNTIIHDTVINVKSIKNNNLFFRTVSNVNQLGIINSLESERMVIPEKLQIELHKIPNN